MTNIKTIILSAAEKIERLDAEILLGFVLKKSRGFLYAHLDYSLSEVEAQQFQGYLEARILGKPIAYITQTREFWSLPLTVTEATLIPRHESETVVELTLSLLSHQPEAKILELGTGSGAIALALAKERPNWQLMATDISPDALKIAQKNAADLKISNIDFYLSDWFQSIPQTRFHAIVANPPYIPENDPHLKEGDLRFEPQSALISGKNGLFALQSIIKQSYNYLEPQGLILLEHGCDQKSAVVTILKQSGYTNIRSWQDSQLKDRVTGGQR